MSKVVSPAHMAQFKYKLLTGGKYICITNELGRALNGGKEPNEPYRLEWVEKTTLS